MTVKTISQLVTAIDGIAGKAAGLQSDLEASIKASKDVKGFQKELYAAAKAKSPRCYMAVQKMFSRAIKALGVTPVNKARGANANKAKADKAAAKDAPKAGGMTDALALARVGQLASAFLTTDDKAIMTRLLAAISHKLQGATKGKAKA